MIYNETDITNSKDSSIEIARELLLMDVVVTDTETTGLESPRALSVASVSCRTREVLIDELTFTVHPIHPKAYEVHGISFNDIGNARQFPPVFDDLVSKLKGRSMTAFNKEYDTGVFYHSLDDHGISGDKMLDKVDHLFNADCVMYMCADFFGTTNKYGTISLANSMKKAGLEFKGKAHSALADVNATIDLIHFIANQRHSTELAS